MTRLSSKAVSVKRSYSSSFLIPEGVIIGLRRFLVMPNAHELYDGPDDDVKNKIVPVCHRCLTLRHLG
jgi:hypothetical protein